MNETTAGDQTEPAVAVSPAGDTVIAWSGNGDGDDDGVFFSRYNPEGVKQGGDVRAAQSTAGVQADPAIAMDANGGFMLVWSGAGNRIGQQDSGGVFGRVFDPSGNPVTGEFRINNVTAAAQTSPSVAFHPKGYYIVTWQSFDQEGSGAFIDNTWGIYARRYAADGQASGNEFRVNTSLPLDQVQPVVATHGTGSVVAWSGAGPGEGNGVFFQRYDPDLVPQGNQTLVNLADNDVQSSPAIAYDPSGQFLMAWQDEGQGNLSKLNMRLLDSAGKFLTFQSEFSDSSADRRNLTLHADADGVFTILFEAKGEGDDRGIFGTHVRLFHHLDSLGGTPFFRANETTEGDQTLPALGAASNGIYTLAWASESQDGDRSGVVLRRFTFPSQVAVSSSRNPSTSGQAVTVTATVSGANGAADVPAGYVTFFEGTTVLAQNVPLDAAGKAEFTTASLTPGEHPLFAEYRGDVNYGPALQSFTQYVGVGPSPGEYQANSFGIGHQWNSDVARDAAGNFVAAWQSEDQEGDGKGIYAQRFSAVGLPQGPEIHVNTATTGDQINPAVAMAADGRFVVVWQSNLPSPGGIFYQRFNADGTPQGGESKAESSPGAGNSSPDVATDANGNFVIVWGSSVSGTPDVQMRRFNAAGEPQGGEVKVNTYTPGTQDQPAVAMNAVGRFVVVWRSYNQLTPASLADLYGQRFDAAGERQDNEFLIDGGLGLQEAAAVAISPTGSFLAVWESRDNPNDPNPNFVPGVFARRFPAQGPSFESKTKVNTLSQSIALLTFPAVAMDDNGNALVAWHGVRSADNVTAIFGQKYAASGAAQGAEFTLNVYGGSVQNLPGLAGGGNGEFVASWDSAQDGSQSGVFGRVFHLGATTTLIPSADPVKPGQSVTLTAKVSPASGLGNPTGTVTFKDGDTPLETVTLNQAGEATFTTSSLTEGTHILSAVYGGDGNFFGNTGTLANGLVVSIRPQGDIDDSGTVTVADAVLLLRHLVGVNLLTEGELAYAEMDNDNDVNVADAVAILRVSVGLPI